MVNHCIDDDILPLHTCVLLNIDMCYHMSDTFSFWSFVPTTSSSIAIARPIPRPITSIANGPWMESSILKCILITKFNGKKNFIFVINVLICKIDLGWKSQRRKWLSTTIMIDETCKAFKLKGLAPLILLSASFLSCWIHLLYVDSVCIFVICILGESENDQMRQWEWNDKIIPWRILFLFIYNPRPTAH